MLFAFIRWKGGQGRSASYLLSPKTLFVPVLFLLLRFVIIRFHGNPPPEIGVTGFSGIFIVCSSAICIHAGTKVDAARKNVPEMETCCRKETQNEETRFFCRIASSFVRHEGTGPPGRE